MNNSNEEKILKIFHDTHTLIKGHFKLRNGFHSEYYFQCAQVCQYLDKVEQLVSFLIEDIIKLNVQFQTVLAPAIGGLVIGQELARQLRKRFIFVEKDNNGNLQLRRNFKININESILIVEDVITLGGRANESINIIKQKKGIPVALIALVDRSDVNKTHFDIPFTALIKKYFPIFASDNLPEYLKKLPLDKPGSY